jgi:diguanylate cyclase (GGDEF)-like protein
VPGDQTRRITRAVLGVGVVVAALTAIAAQLLVVGEPRLVTPLEVSGLWLGLAFFGCEVYALRVQRTHGESYGFTLALVALVVGLVYGAPVELLIARIAGAVGGLLVVRHRRATEAVYEIAVQAAQTVAAIAVYRFALDGEAPVSVHGALSLVAALAASWMLSVLPLAAVVIVVDRGWPRRRVLVTIVRAGALAAVLNGGIGIGLASALWDHPYVLLLATAIVLACLACNQIYRGLVHRYRGLQTHYEFVSSVVRSKELPEVAASVLAAAKALLRANDAVLLLGPAGEDEPATLRRLSDGGGRRVVEVSPAQHAADLVALMPAAEPRRVDLGAAAPHWLREIDPVSALAAPITTSEGTAVGALVVTQTQRKVVAWFGDAAADLLGELAAQASVAIENGLLFHQLEREAADRAHQATHDPLTGLPNRAMLTEVLAGALEHAYATRGRVGLLVVDLDSFSQVVDAFGHSSADGLLIQACSRIRGLLPESATLARLAGEQFAIVMPDVADADTVIRAARLLIAGFDPPFQSEGVLLALSVNVGIAVYPEQAVDAQSLMQRAHIAADTAHRHGSGWEQYDPINDPATPRRLALAADLREALETDGLDVCFQPKVELATGIVRGAEALVRWNHARLGRVRPDEFITIAEQTGDIRALTMVVMRKALAECSAWRAAGLDMSVAVNLSARNLLDLHLVDDVAAAIDEARLPAAALTLELTESMVMSDSRRSEDVLAGLNGLGVRLSCDDFGTGYSSLAHLRKLPISEIKIDKSFIARIAVEESDRAIARSVLALGRDLGLVTVAEGVESREGWDLLTELGCDMAQGFVVCPPLTSHQFGDWLDRRQPEEFAFLPMGDGDRDGADGGARDDGGRSDDPRADDPRAHDPRADDLRAHDPRADDPRAEARSDDPRVEARSDDPRGDAAPAEALSEAPSGDGDDGDAGGDGPEGGEPGGDPAQTSGQG